MQKRSVDSHESANAAAGPSSAVARHLLYRESTSGSGAQVSEPQLSAWRLKG